MTATVAAEVLGVGLVTPVGLTAASVSAAVRAGISRVRRTPIRNRQLDSLHAAFLDDVHLPPLISGLSVPANLMTARHKRMLRLATLAAQEATQLCTLAPPLLLALPEPTAATDLIGPAFLEDLAHQGGVKLDLRHSKVLRRGRAGGLLVLRSALELLGSGHFPSVLVGSVDTHMDLRLLASLGAENRLRTELTLDGFIPGEGAAFLLLALPTEARRQKRTPIARVVGAGVGREPGHRYSQEPYLGEGLADAFHALFASVPTGLPLVRCVYAGFNGENFWAKEWGVAYLRTRERFIEEPRVEHPAEYVGDPGAAYGPLMVGLAAMGLRDGYREGPLLVWCSSDREERGAVLLQATSSEEA